VMSPLTFTSVVIFGMQEVWDSGPLTAQLLCRDDLSVDEVASKVGFSSRSHFSHTFREHFGDSPLAFREGHAS
jgi:methylphosphotriester-DNA--protein-cysteine methyltransferase